MNYPPQYPPAQPQYQPPYPPQPQYQPPYPSQQPAYPPAPPQYPPQPQYQQPQFTQAPAQPLARGTIDDFYEQPAASGKSISFDQKPPGTTYTGLVARTLTNADIQPQTDMRDKTRALAHPDGRPKLVMIVPLQLQPSQEFPDGRAAWYVKGADKAELERAMEAAGLKPGTPPEAGALITITYTGDRPIPGLNPQKVKAITYTRPQGAAQPPAEMATNLQPQAQQPAQAPYATEAPQQYQQPYAGPVSYPGGQAAQDTVTGNGNAQNWAPQPAPQQPPFQAPYQQPQQPPQAPQQAPAGPDQPLQPPADLSAAQQQLLARLAAQ